MNQTLLLDIRWIFVIGQGSSDWLLMLERIQDALMKYSKKEGGEPVVHNKLFVKQQTSAYLLHKTWHQCAYKAGSTDHVIRATAG